jgi:SAM-dependent methyltransferase
MICIESLNCTFPKYPKTVSDKGWIYGVWYCPTAWMRTHFYGQFPLTFLKRVLALFPNAKDILQCPSGTVTGPGITVDLIRDEKRNPQIIAPAELLPFADNSFDLYISDPPYSPNDSKKYGTPPFKGKAAMSEARRVLRTGGYYCLLHTRYPSFKRKDWNFVALIAVVTGANRCVRLLSIFQKPEEIGGATRT